MSRQVSVGVSFKMYFGHREALEWCRRAAELVAERPAVRSGAVRVFVIPTYLQIPAAIEAFAGTGVLVGAQDVAAADAGAFTGEVSAAELHEIGAGVAEVGHAERRRLFAETDETTAAKTAAAVRNGLIPVICVGEADHLAADDAARATSAQLARSLAGVDDGPVIVAYEPVWAIGAPHPAPTAHIRTVLDALAADIAQSGRAGSSVIYGGSAGPGLLDELDGAADGLFLGRFAHDPLAFAAVLDEATALADERSRA